MRKATAIYHAPEGDSKVVEMGGVTFFDGQPAELNDNEHGHIINKLPGNKHFEIDIGEDDGEAAGHPSKQDFKAGIEEARDHDFEQDRRDGIDKKPIAELRQLAEERGIDHKDMSKAELRDALSK